MALKHTFSKEEISEIENARKINKNKRVESRLKALELRAKGVADKEIARQTEFYPSTISRLVTKYKKNGIEAITGNHYHGNRRNMSIEEEAAILAPFREKAEKGQIVEISEIKAAYQAKVDHPISAIRSILSCIVTDGTRLCPGANTPKRPMMRPSRPQKN